MNGNKFEKSNIHILEPETLSREYRVTESTQEIDDSIPCIIAYIRTNILFVKTFILLFVCTLQEWRDFTWRVSDC